MGNFIEILSGTVMPIMLILCGIVMSFKIRLTKKLSPANFFTTLKESSIDEGNTPVKSLCTALAGTLGVGNMAGVATAITLGGAGAVMWMWVGAIISMSVKYSEVVLALKYRRRITKGEYEGGSMYTVKYGMRKYIGKQGADFCGGFFALLCIVNSMLTGNLIQTQSAIYSFSHLDPMYIGFLMTAVFFIIIFTKASISGVTCILIPVLSLVFSLLSLSIIIYNINMIPEIIKDIFYSAFSIKTANAGVLGFGMREAVRYGITRGMFSNESGCGTSPTAHASANVVSPHHQGCFGIFEVIADTLILCSMTAFVILIADKKYSVTLLGDGINVTVKSFELMLGKTAGVIISVSVVMFAFATIIAQLYYGLVAIRYFSNSVILERGFILISAVIILSSSFISQNIAWTIADVLISTMTALNVSMIFIMRNEVRSLSEHY